MSILILSYLFRHRFFLLNNKLVHLFLILVAMFMSISASPQVTADFTTLSVNAGCGSLVVDFQDLTTGAPNTWLWDFGNGNSSTLQNPTVIYANSGEYDVSLTVTDNITNDYKVSNAMIKVYENPTSDITTNSLLNGCLPLIVNFEDLSYTNNSIQNWQWDFGDGGSSSLQYPVYNYTNAGSYSVSLLITDINGCQSLSTQYNLIDVYELPIADFIVDIPFSCNQNEVVTFTNNTLGLADYTWDFGDSITSNLENPTHNYLSGEYNVSLLAKIGTCIDTLVKTNYVAVGKEINSNFISDINQGCEGMQVNFTDITTNDPDAWLWDFGDGSNSTLQNPVHVFLNPGEFDVTFTTSKAGQCIDTKIFYDAIKVYSNPDIQIIADTTYGCSFPFNVEFSDATNNAVSYIWDFGNGTNSILTAPTVSYLNYGSYDVNLSVTNINGCISTKLYNDFIEVEKININITTSKLNGCTPLNINFSDSTNSIRPIVDWSWSFGDGYYSNIQNPTHQYNSSNLFDVSLSVKNDYGCISNKNFPELISIYEIPQTDFHANQLISCVGEDISFSDLTLFTSAVTNWFWDFGDGNTSYLQNPIYQYQLSGVYDVSLIASSNNCIDTFEILNLIEIIEPTAIFNEEYNCDNPLEVEFENLSIGADEVIWNFGDGNISTQLNPIHTYSVKGTYSVTLTVSNNLTGCSDEFVKMIKLTIPEASFDYLINSNNGYEDSIVCTPKRVYLNNTSQDMSYFKVLWSDGYVGYGIIDHLILDTGQLDVTMIVSDIHQCKDTMIHKNMFRANTVNADFEIINILGCDSMLIDFKDLSLPESSVSWEFGDGGTSIINNPQHIYYTEDYYDVTLYVESLDGCKDTLNKNEYIQFQYPSADLTSNIQQTCPNNIIQFNNISDGIGITSQWDFGDGSQSNQINPSHSFIANGLYNISLQITDSFSCTNNIVLSDFIKILKPTANFLSTGITSSCPPLISGFSNFSSNDVIHWQWNFSDGGSSSVASPSHLFSVSGIFDVSLIVENSFGCKDTLIQNELVSVLGPTGSFSISDSLICTGDSVQFIPIVNNTDHYLWDFGNGVISNDSIPFHVYNTNGTYFPSLIIENSIGCQNTINNSDTINVKSVNVDAGINIEICEGEYVQLNAIGNATQFTWYPAQALTNSNIENPIANPNIDMMYYINHSDGICNSNDSIFIKVNNEVPLASFTSINHCDGDSTYFSASSALTTNNINWEWSFGSNIKNPSHQLNLGANIIRLIVINLDNNCSDTNLQNVDINPTPNAEFQTSEICFEEMSSFLNNSSPNVVSWEYNMGDGIGISLLENPNYTYLNSGTFYPILVVTSDSGCTNEFIRKIEINELPIADFKVENNCIGEKNIFTDISTITNGYISSWNYIFGDNTIDGLSQNEQHEYALSGSYNVKLNVISEKGCQSSILKETKVFDAPVIDFSTNQFCLGTPTYFTNFSTLNNGNIIKWKWDFGDNSENTNLKDPNYIFTNDGIYTVNLTATTEFDCSSMLDKKITIYKLPKASFSNDSIACVDDEIRFTDKSISTSNNIISWEWSIGDSTILNTQNPIHQYKYAQKFDVNLAVTTSEGCLNDTTIFNAVEVFNNPVADFYANTYITTELNSEINFYNNSLNSKSYYWDFDNNITSSETNPMIDFLEIRSYDVLLKVISEEGCDDEIVKNVNILPEYNLYTPNSFTPNGDGNNDIFLAEGKSVSSFEMQIFNRWGGLIFKSYDIEYGWDGLDSKNNKVEIGTYLFNISLYDYNGKLWIYNGEINLMR